jgi:hypothetical protein
VSPVPTIPIQAMETPWADTLVDKLGPTTVLTLRDSYLLEWYSRSPGLYHRECAAESRQEAANHVMEAHDTGSPVVLTKMHPNVRDVFYHSTGAEHVFA